MKNETQVMDPLAVSVITAIERAEEYVGSAKERMQEAINAKLEAASLVATIRRQKGGAFSGWWQGNIGHRYAIAVGKELCKLHSLAAKRPVEADRASLSLVGLLPGPRHDAREQREDDAAWDGIADFAVACAARLEKLARLIDLYGQTLTETEKDMAEGRMLRFGKAARDAIRAVDRLMGAE